MKTKNIFPAKQTPLKIKKNIMSLSIMLNVSPIVVIMTNITKFITIINLKYGFDFIFILTTPPFEHPSVEGN